MCSSTQQHDHGKEAFPVFDLATHEDWPSALGDQIVEALKQWGFMLITGHGISQESIQDMFDMNKAFCSQPVEVKSEHVINKDQIGYDLRESKIGVSENMAFGGIKGAVKEGGNIPSWWDADRRNRIEQFKASSHALGIKLLQVFAREFGLSTDYFSSAHCAGKGPGSVLRMLHYPQLDSQPDVSFPRLYAHTDWGSLTFVWPQSGGLEVETPAKEWMEVPLLPGAIVVNVGDALSLWSGGALKSTLHRISFDKLPIDLDRWSMAYFLNANEDAKLEILQQGADKVFKKADINITLTAGEYTQVRLYMSQKEDARNNWIGSAGDEMEKLQPLVQAVEKLGIANGSGVVNFSPVQA